MSWTGIIVGIAIITALAAGFYRLALGSPECTCGRQDCGGGCIKR